MSNARDLADHGVVSAPHVTILSADANDIIVTGLDTPNYRFIRGFAWGELTSPGQEMFIEARATAGTWRTVGQIACGAGANRGYGVAFDIFNFNNADGSGFRMCKAIAGGTNFALVNTNGGNTFEDTPVSGGGWYHTAEAWAELRVRLTAGDFFKGTIAGDEGRLYVWGE